MAIPIIDERIKHVGPATLRKMDALKLRGLRELMVIQDGDEPLAVLIPYEMYLEMQREVINGDAAIAAATAEPSPMPGLDKLFMREGPVDALPKINPDDYGKTPAGLPVTINDGCQQPNGGTDGNPDMAHSKSSYRGPSTERREFPRSGSTVDMLPNESKSDIANDIVAPSPGPHPPVRGIPFVIENEPEPFQGQSGNVIDQIHETDSGWATPHCDHCGKPGAALCPECFVAGHRAVANCQQCAERQS